MDEVQDGQVESRAYTWTIRALYVSLIAANVWLVFDWWRETPQGTAYVERWRTRWADAKAKAENCEGCARRKARLQAAINRMHWDAERIVEGQDVDTQPEGP